MSTTTVNGVTFVGASKPVKFSDMVAAFGAGYNKLSAMRNKKWYKSDFTRGTFAASGSFSLSNILGTGGNIPHVDRTAWPAAGNWFPSGSAPALPKFNTIIIAVYGGSGGGGGANGDNYYSGAHHINPGAAGGSGGTTSLTLPNSTTLSAGGGGGGNQGTNGADAASAGYGPIAGGAGYGNGGAGGTAGFTVDADTNYSLASTFYGAVLTPSAYGGAGSGGTGGLNFINGVLAGQAANGAGGTAGGFTIFIDNGLY